MRKITRSLINSNVQGCIFFVLMSPNMFMFIIITASFFVLTAGAVLKPRDPGVRWICQPAKSGASQICEKRI